MKELSLYYIDKQGKLKIQFSLDNEQDSSLLQYWTEKDIPENEFHIKPRKKYVPKIKDNNEEN